MVVTDGIIRKFVADMLACASNLLHIKCYLRKLRDEFSISAIIFSRYATHRIPYMMENLSMVSHGSLCQLWHGDFSYYVIGGNN